MRANLSYDNRNKKIKCLFAKHCSSQWERSLRLDAKEETILDMIMTAANGCLKMISKITDSKCPQISSGKRQQNYILKMPGKSSFTVAFLPIFFSKKKFPDEGARTNMSKRIHRLPGIHIDHKGIIIQSQF